LAAAGGRARVLARPGGAAFVTAAGEIVWLRPASAPLHPRAVLVAPVPATALGEELRMDLAGLTPWQPPALALDAAALVRLRATWPAALAELVARATPAGFGAPPTGAPLAFPLDT